PDAASTDRYPLSLHDALPIWHARRRRALEPDEQQAEVPPPLVQVLEVHQAPPAHDRHPVGHLLDLREDVAGEDHRLAARPGLGEDRKSTRLNSSHVKISYAVF